ncbi:MAG: type IV secretion system protein [Burkholderiales bacterium]|nr:type IV secretion system protein [Burkholderiales bacterium]
MQTVTCAIHSGGILDGIVTQFGNIAYTWQNQINPIAKNLFYLLFSMEFMWQLVVKKIFAGDVEKIWVFFFTRTVLGFFFAHYVIDLGLYEHVIEYIANLGSRISGYSLSLTPGSNFNTMGPSEVIGNFACVADSIHQITDSTGSFQYITVKFALALMEVLLFVVLSLLAFYLIKIIVQAYFVVYVAFILTGFAGSSWTVSFWQRYVQTVSGVAIKFLAVCFLLGILNGQMHGWAIDINAAADILDLSAVVARVLCSAIIIALLSHQLPEWAAAQLAGNINVQFFSPASTSSPASFEDIQYSDRVIERSVGEHVSNISGNKL